MATQIASATTFSPLILKNMDLSRPDQMREFQKQVSDILNQLVTRVNAGVITSSIAGWAFYSAGSVTTGTTMANITSWSATASTGMAITLASSTTFTVSGISVVHFNATAAADTNVYDVQINPTSGNATGLGGGGGLSTSYNFSMAALQSAGSFTIQAQSSAAAGTLNPCTLGIYMFNL